MKLKMLTFVLLSFGFHLYAQDAQAQVDSSSYDNYVQDLFKRLESQGALRLHKSLYQPANRSYFKMKWKEDAKTKSLYISLQNKNDKLNVNIENQSILISGIKVSQVRQGGRDSGKVLSTSRHSFSSKVAIPRDIDGSSASFKHIGEDIVIKFKKKSSEDGLEKRRPLKFKGDKVI